NNANARWRSSNPDYMARYYGANRSRWVDYVAARKARKIAATVGSFRARDVFARDEYRCYLCGRTTDPKLSPQHPMRTVLEHKTPLSRGGAHSLTIAPPRAGSATPARALRPKKNTRRR